MSRYFELMTPQKNIWNLQSFYKNTAIANLCGDVFLEGKYDIGTLRQVLNEIVKKHTALRLRICERNGEIVQYVEPFSYNEFEVREFDTYKEYVEYAENIAKTPIGMESCSLYRFVIVKVEEKIGILSCISHLISDAWSFSLLVREIKNIYEQKETLSNGFITNNIEGDYTEFVQTDVLYRSSQKFIEDGKYFEEEYCNKAEVSLSSKVTGKNIAGKRIVRKLSKCISDRMNRYCVKKRVSQAIVFEVGLYIYLYHTNRDTNAFTIGMPVINRRTAKEKKTVGMFVSTMPLTISMSGKETISELIDKISAKQHEVFKHCKYPISSIMERIRKKRDFEGNFYNVMFSFQNAQTNTGMKTNWYSNGYSEVPFSLHVDNRDSNDTYTITIDYQTECFRNEAEIHHIIERLEFILGQIVECDNVLVNDISILPEKEKNKLLYEFNDTKVDYPMDKCVHELFMEQAAKKPDAIAVVFEDKEITYKELDEMSNVLANILIERGVGQGDIIPIISKRNWHILIAMLGILKAGAGYMPVAPDYPKDRVQFIVNEAKSKVGCTFGYDEKLDGIEILKLDEIEFDKAEEDKKMPPKNRNSAEDICYVIYTSGSTGRPKGVKISHKNLSNFVQVYKKNHYQYSLFKNAITVLSTTSIIFDIFVFETILPLVHGLKVIIPNDEEIISAKCMSCLIQKYHVDAMHITPTKIGMFMDNKSFRDSMSSMKVLMIGAEKFSVSLYKKLSKCTDALIYNGYGPAETTIGVTFKEVDKSDITIGRPIANTQIYILDKHSNPVPIGVPGELCIAGNGVGLGYLNRPDLTAERFVENPFATEENGHGKTMYHTGDLAVWREDGEIEYLGRIDTQVKIRGLRIELGEIESVMSEFPGIRMCAVTDKTDEEGRQYLVGYYTTDSDEKEDADIMTAVKVDEKELRKYLLSKLPKYMVPNYFMHLKKLPMTPSGKTDRKNLPVPEMQKKKDEIYVTPKTEIQKTLCEILVEILKCEKIGIDDDYFEYGGDSLGAIKYVTEAKCRGINFSVQQVFEYPTVRSLSCHIENEDCVKIFESGDFQKYNNLLKGNFQNKTEKKREKSPGNILLTGATGFLGAHVLAELLEETQGKIYCLIRDNAENNYCERLKQVLIYYFGTMYESEFGERIIPIVGAIESIDSFQRIHKDVQTVIHIAANVKHYGNYSDVYGVNVIGTKNVVEFAKQKGAKLFHISTLSVGGQMNNLEKENKYTDVLYTEENFYVQQSLENIYVRSKFEAEKVVYDALLEGLDAKVIRVGNLTNRSSDYLFQPNYKENAFLRRFKAFIQLGCIPKSMMQVSIDFSPVDLTAEGIVKIVQYSDNEKVFHLNTNRIILFQELVEKLSGLGILVRVVEESEFDSMLHNGISDERKNIMEALHDIFDTQGKLDLKQYIRTDNSATIKYLANIGFEWDYDVDEYIAGYVEYFRRIGYIKE